MTLEKDNFAQVESTHPPPLKGTRSFTQIQTHTEGQNSHKQNTFLSAANSITKNHPLWVEIK